MVKQSSLLNMRKMAHGQMNGKEQGCSGQHMGAQLQDDFLPHPEFLL